MGMSVLLLLFKQKAAYDLRIRDWSSGVCSSDLTAGSPMTPKPMTVGSGGSDAGSRAPRPTKLANSADMMMARLCVIEPAASRTAWGEAPLEFREKRVQFGGRHRGQRDQRPVVRRADWRERSRTVSSAPPLRWPNHSTAP